MLLTIVAYHVLQFHITVWAVTIKTGSLHIRN